MTTTQGLAENIIDILRGKIKLPETGDTTSSLLDGLEEGELLDMTDSFASMGNIEE